MPHKEKNTSRQHINRGDRTSPWFVFAMTSLLTLTLALGSAGVIMTAIVSTRLGISNYWWMLVIIWGALIINVFIIFIVSIQRRKIEWG